MCRFPARPVRKERKALRGRRATRALPVRMVNLAPRGLPAPRASRVLPVRKGRPVSKGLLELVFLLAAQLDKYLQRRLIVIMMLNG